MQFSAPNPARWYLRLSTDPGLVTQPLDEVAGSVVDSCLPRGANSVRWNRYANECQMLLHAHPVNDIRETEQRLPINGVWLWGGGRWAPVPGHHFSAVAAWDPLTLALAAHADVPATTPGKSAVEWFATASPGVPDGRNLLVLSQLTGVARCGDLDAWRRALEALDRDWIAPLLSALKAGALRKLVLVAPGSAGCPRFELSRAALLRFWRRSRPLDVHAPAAST